MAQRALIDLNKLAKDLRKIEDKITKVEETATVRTLNKIADRSKSMIAKDLNNDHGIAIGTAKRRIDVVKAKKGNYNAQLIMKDTRVTYPQPRKIKQGVSFLSQGKKRIKITTKISTPKGQGSRPFIIKGRHSGKKLPVYVLPNYTKYKKSSERKVQAMYFSSIPHLARKDWQTKVQGFSLQEFKKEYPKQLKSASKGY